MDVRVHRIRRDGDAERPGLIEQLVATERLSRMTQKRLQEQELARAEVHRPVSDRDGAGRLVESDRAGHETRSRPTRARLRTPAEGSQASRKLVVGERLHEVVVSAGVEAG